eukprot:TRINITY_DN106744_c0_g1_i1.p1 TRINITY_DN106744_c0_g1~~TRINITY_DN106744_c0_g1_i1.p1  ORF type:complete len:251 (+),score=33.26 TRINITY_DN106744_c0_g1_i1:42-755(+)
MVLSLLSSGLDSLKSLFGVGDCPASNLGCWKAFVKHEQCEPWLVPYALGKVRGDERTTARLAFQFLPKWAWQDLQRLSGHLAPLAQRVNAGQPPLYADSAHLANVLYLIFKLRKDTKKYLDLGYGSVLTIGQSTPRREDDINADEAWRMATALDRLDESARFLFSVTWPCAKPDWTAWQGADAALKSQALPSPPTVLLLEAASPAQVRSPAVARPSASETDWRYRRRSRSAALMDFI